MGRDMSACLVFVQQIDFIPIIKFRDGEAG